MSQSSLASLRKFVPVREDAERCDLCQACLPSDHAHQFDPFTRRIICACSSCAMLSDGRYKTIPERVCALQNFEMTDVQWDELMIPISLAFFSYSTPASRTIALYPGPAGAAESSLRLDSWQEISARNPVLNEMLPDVEALLVNRVGAAHEYYLVPVGECYKLVGLIRIHWRGLSGGAIVWGEISQFFSNLRRKAAACSP